MENIKFHYDREADVMYFSLGLPKKAKTLEIADDFILRTNSGDTLLNSGSCPQR